VRNTRQRSARVDAPRFAYREYLSRNYPIVLVADLHVAAVSVIAATPSGRSTAPTHRTKGSRVVLHPRIISHAHGSALRHCCCSGDESRRRRLLVVTAAVDARPRERGTPASISPYHCPRRESNAQRIIRMCSSVSARNLD
jgi:hypothetical protein